MNGTRRSSLAGRRWISVGVGRLITNSFSLLVDESQRLLEQRRWWRTLGHGSFHYIESVFMHMDHGEGTGSIAVGELQPMSFDSVGVIDRIIRNLGVSLKEFPRRIDNRSSQIGLRVVGADVRIRPGSFAVLRALRVYFSGVCIVDHSDGVAVRTILVAVDAPR